LVPAHDESIGLVPTLDDLRQQLQASDRLLVVADNCSDDTAAMATKCGAEVIERHDLARRGKGYALDFGIKHLSSAPPDILIMVDADCRIAHGTIGALVKMCAASHRPTQALYLMTSPPGAEINQQVAEFAWRVKNWLRPSGLAALNLPCQLTGTGMAFPWDVIRSVDLASGSIVEDLKLGLDLAASGHPPIFCPSALVMSQFASSAQGSRTQRERWEGGHIATILTAVPHLLGKSVARRDLNLLAITLDLLVPPLSLLTLVAMVVLACTSVWALLGFSALPFLLSSATFLGFVLAGFLAWLKCGRDILPVSQIPSIVAYVVKKLGLYGVILFGKSPRSWKRTER
jgi:cellulose synthase/poly-beta-1,6-N-acetylglucosamine synthase-like glycosyltransferase